MDLLVAVDGSQEAESALAYATDIADAMDGSITAVHDVDPTEFDRQIMLIPGDPSHSNRPETVIVANTPAVE